MIATNYGSSHVLFCIKLKPAKLYMYITITIILQSVVTRGGQQAIVLIVPLEGGDLVEVLRVLVAPAKVEVDGYDDEQETEPEGQEPLEARALGVVVDSTEGDGPRERAGQPHDLRDGADGVLVELVPDPVVPGGFLQLVLRAGERVQLGVVPAHHEVLSHVAAHGQEHEGAEKADHGDVHAVVVGGRENRAHQQAHLAHGAQHEAGEDAVALVARVVGGHQEARRAQHVAVAGLDGVLRRAGRPAVRDRLVAQRAPLERPPPAALEVLARERHAVAQALPPGARDEQRPQVRRPDVRDVHGELRRVHEPVDRVALPGPARQHRHQHAPPRDESNPWHDEKPIAWLLEQRHSKYRGCSPLFASGLVFA